MPGDHEARGFNFEEEDFPASSERRTPSPLPRQGVPLSAQPEEVHSIGYQPKAAPGTPGPFSGDPLLSAEATPPPAATEPTETDWTKQYQRPVSREKQRLLEEDLQRAGDSSALEYSDMASIYVPADKVKDVRSARLTYSLPSEQRPYPWRTIWVLVFLFVAAVVVVLFTLKIETGQRSPGGDAIHATLPEILWMRISGFKEASRDPAIMGYVLTRERIRSVEAACNRYHAKAGSYPESAQVLVDEGYLAESDSYDGWGNRFLVFASVAQVRSSGQDGILDSSDDIYVQDSKVQVPPFYEAYEIEKVEKTGF